MSGTKEREEEADDLLCFSSVQSFEDNRAISWQGSARGEEEEWYTCKERSSIIFLQANEILPFD